MNLDWIHANNLRVNFGYGFPALIWGAVLLLSNCHERSLAQETSAPTSTSRYNLLYPVANPGEDRRLGTGWDDLNEVFTVVYAPDGSGTFGKQHSMGRNPARLVFDRSGSSRGVLAFVALMLDALSSQAHGQTLRSLEADPCAFFGE